VHGDSLRVRELVGAEAERCTNRRVELAHGPPAERVDRVIERANALDGAVGKPLGERALARLEARGCGAKDTIRVRVVLEDAQDDVVRSSPGCQRSPRLNSSYVIRRLPSGWTSSSSSSPS
jgi:hypothetical protein